MSRMTRTSLGRHLIAVAVVLLTFAVKGPIERLVGPGPPLIFFVPAVTISAWQGGGGLRALRKEAGELRGALEDRKVIERAKGILMKTTGLDEPEVFRRLQKLSRDQIRRWSTSPE